MKTDIETPTEESALKTRLSFFQNTLRQRYDEINSENNEKLCLLGMISCFGIILFVLLFGLLPMPVGYAIYIVIYPGSNIAMFSILTWGVGILSLCLFFSGCGSCCFCFYCCCFA